jgi:hypothetical protein
MGKSFQMVSGFKVVIGSKLSLKIRQAGWVALSRAGAAAETIKLN